MKKYLIGGCTFDPELKGKTITDKKIKELRELGIYPLIFEVNGS